MRTTYTTKKLIEELNKIQRLDIIASSNVKIDSFQAGLIDYLYKPATFNGTPLKLSMLHDNIDGHNFEAKGFRKFNDYFYVGLAKGYHKKYTTIFIEVENNKVIDWFYGQLEHDNGSFLLDTVDSFDLKVAMSEDNYSYLHHIAPFDSRKQEEVKKSLEASGFYVF